MCCVLSDSIKNLKVLTLKHLSIQWEKLRNCDVIEDKKIRHFSKF